MSSALIFFLKINDVSSGIQDSGHCGGWENMVRVFYKKKTFSTHFDLKHLENNLGTWLNQSIA
jgi:hypothetical protein